MHRLFFFANGMSACVEEKLGRVSMISCCNVLAMTTIGRLYLFTARVDLLFFWEPVVSSMSCVCKRPMVWILTTALCNSSGRRPTFFGAANVLHHHLFLEGIAAQNRNQLLAFVRDARQINKVVALNHALMIMAGARSVDKPNQTFGLAHTKPKVAALPPTC